MTKGTVKKRTRLDPETRKQLILDAAASVVTSEGVSAVSMERMGREAGISKALVYNYFSSRDELLAALLRREYVVINEEYIESTFVAKDIEELCRLTSRSYLIHARDKGNLLQRLNNEPAIAELAKEQRSANEKMMNRFLVKLLKKTYNLPTKTAVICVDMMGGLIAYASKHVYQNTDEAGFQLVEDLVVEMTMASLKEASKKHGVKSED
jgi:TetR/AcrR family transcriptional regulator, fatty acid biosynthesis regulator